jgi:hypothetical protein
VTGADADQASVAVLATSDKANKQTKAELHAILAEAVRNTQPAPKDKRDPTKGDPAPKRTAKFKRVRG